MVIDLGTLREQARKAPVATGSTTAPIDVAAIAARHEAALMRLVAMAAAPDSSRDRIVQANAGVEAAERPDPAIACDRVAASRAHDAARQLFYARHQPAEALERQRAAFASDPFHVEGAGHVALYALACDRLEEARDYAILAVILRRDADGVGRAFDWMTLGATLGARGDAAGATGALVFTLATARDPTARCRGAAAAVRDLYRDLLRDACAAMLDRAEAWGVFADSASASSTRSIQRW